MKFGFIGLGNMNSAIIKGFSKVSPSTTLLGYNRTLNKAELIAKETTLQVCHSIKEVMTADVIVLGVQPQQLAAVAPTIAAHKNEKQLFISIAAGKSIETLSTLLQTARVVRVMPNINSIVGASTTCYSASSACTEEDHLAVQQLFEAIGSIIQLPEEQFTIFSAIAGASPAFTYLYIDSLARAAVREGMDKKIALQIAADAVLGSAKMVLQSDEHPWALVDQVCSPGGTTIQGVSSLQENQFASTIYDAVQAVIEKDHALS